MSQNKNKKSTTLVSTLKFSLMGLGTIILFALIMIALILMPLFSPPDFKELPAYHPFKSTRAQERYLKHYDLRAQKWPVASETRYVETSFGSTFVRISGPVDAPPLIVLPGAGGTSLTMMLIWECNVFA